MINDINSSSGDPAIPSPKREEKYLEFVIPELLNKLDISKYKIAYLNRTRYAAIIINLIRLNFILSVYLNMSIPKIISRVNVRID